MLSEGGVNKMFLFRERAYQITRQSFFERSTINVIYALWCLLGWYLNSDFGPRYDENDYVGGARLLLNGNWEAYVLGGTGTLNRPYAYPVFLAGISIIQEHINSIFMYEEVVRLRSLVTIVQAALFWRATIFLAKSLQKTSLTLAAGVRLGLLGQPFTAFIMSDILSDALSIISWIVLAGLIIRQDEEHRGSGLRNIMSVGFVSAWLVMVRSANLPSMIVCVALYQFRIVVDSVFRRAAPLSFWVGLRGLVRSATLWFGIAMASSVQIAAMTAHMRLSGISSEFWGAGAAASSFGVRMAKYTTAVNSCGERIPAAIIYVKPLGVTVVEEENIKAGITGLMAFYAQNIWYMLLHLFNGINYDFPTTYIMHWNSKLNFVFNIISALIVAIIVTGAYVLRDSWERPLGLWTALEFRWVRMVTILVFVNYGQLAIISVENRYGLVGWAWVSVASASVLVMWRKRGVKYINVLEIMVVLMLTGGILYISNVVTTLAEHIVQAYTVGCI